MISSFPVSAKSSPTETKVPASQSWCVIGDLQPRTPYIFQVLAVNQVGVSGASSTVQTTTQEEGESFHRHSRLGHSRTHAWRSWQLAKMLDDPVSTQIASTHPIFSPFCL